MNFCTAYLAFLTYYWLIYYFYDFCLLIIKSPTEVSTYF